MLADGMLFWTRSVQNGLRVCPQSPRSTIRDGTTRWRMDDDQGVSEYQTALKLDPRNAGTYVLLGMAQKKGGHAELAEKAYRQALEIEPNNIVA
jgi:tetratricopeptide (TPR) repeat protein